MTNDLDTLLTALYVKVDDELEASRWMGRQPQPADAELVTLAVAQALLGFHSESRWLRYAHTHLAAMFPYLPQQSGYNKRLKAALPLVKKAIRMLAVDTDFWFDNHWIVDSTPSAVWDVPADSETFGDGGLGRIWVLRVPLPVLLGPTPVPGLHAGWHADPVGPSPKMDEREVLQSMLDVEAGLVTDRPGLPLISDKGFASKEFENDLAMRGIELLRPSFKREKKRKGARLLKSVRQLIESVNDTLKGQLGLEQHGGRTHEGVAVRVAQRILAMAPTIWHNHKTGAPIMRSLIAFDY